LQSGIDKRQEEGEKGVLCLVRREGEEIQKRRRDSREERPMILTTKRQRKANVTNRRENVCNFNIKFFGSKCPPYNIQISNL
jgi:hypothetical protein